MTPRERRYHAMQRFLRLERRLWKRPPHVEKLHTSLMNTSKAFHRASEDFAGFLRHLDEMSENLQLSPAIRIDDIDLMTGDGSKPILRDRAAYLNHLYRGLNLG